MRNGSKIGRSGTTLAAPSARALELSEVSKSFGAGLGRTLALQRVSLTVRRGEFLAVMGPSGSGKSTLVHVAAGLESPEEGRVVLQDHAMPAKLAHPEWAEARRRRIGVVFQRLNLVPSLTVAENVALPLELDGWSRSRSDAAAEEALARTGTDGLGDRLPHELSGGQRQAVAVARAVVGERALLLADEPTGALDTASAEAVIELLARQAEAGASVVLVTHDSRLAAWADRVVFLRDGAVVDTSTVEAAPAPLALGGPGGRV